jgi:ribonuclease BN (tRNA processing enzyme)
MEIIILGYSGSFPVRGAACSGCLVKAAGKNILVDCGSGVLAQLQYFLPIEELDAVLLTHLHFDHCADLPVLGYGLETKRALGQPISPIPVFLPHSPAQLADILVSSAIFEPVFVEGNQEVPWNSLRIGFTRMPHSIESNAISIYAPTENSISSEKKIVFSGDTVGSADLVEAAFQADLFVCEATTSGKKPKQQQSPHMTAIEAAQIALRAGVKQLCLTHFWYEEDPQEILQAAAQIFKPTCLAKTGLTFSL